MKAQKRRGLALLRLFCIIFLFGITLISLLSCKRSVSEKEISVADNNDTPVVYTGILPMAILQTGEYPLWFQLTENGPVYIETLEDAELTAFVPWPYAFHISYMQENEDSLVMVINRDGYLNIAPNSPLSAEGIALYRFSGGELWQKYTTGGFVYYDGNPVTLLYKENRFLEINEPLPIIRTWTFNMDYDLTFPISIPVFDLFPIDEGWEIDTLRLDKGFYYYRAAKRSGASPSVKMFRTNSLSQQGEEISIDVFYNSFSQKKEFSHLSLPQLPEGYVYTNAGFVGDSLIAAWEEQDEFYIGVAGFMLIKR